MEVSQASFLGHQLLLVHRDASFGFLKDWFRLDPERVNHFLFVFVQFEVFQVIGAEVSSCVGGQPKPLVAEAVFIAVSATNIPKVIPGSLACRWIIHVSRGILEDLEVSLERPPELETVLTQLLSLARPACLFFLPIPLVETHFVDFEDAAPAVVQFVLFWVRQRGVQQRVCFMELFHDVGRTAFSFVDDQHVVVSIVGDQRVVFGCLLWLEGQLILV